MPFELSESYIFTKRHISISITEWKAAAAQPSATKLYNSERRLEESEADYAQLPGRMKIESSHHLPKQAHDEDFR